jgi:hypothetical protein
MPSNHTSRGIHITIPVSNRHRRIILSYVSFLTGIAREHFAEDFLNYGLRILPRLLMREDEMSPRENRRKISESP